jgi:hypothetical protein
MKRVSASAVALLIGVAVYAVALQAKTSKEGRSGNQGA